ncbi:MAG: Mrp/NBP35 family ATP-binding protein [Bifidobacteriaceae bacterium]|jgi:ATP-binding protein involved in chromosome partitioning|nr:Mrp/NBP35 family ATP-binding protein [Bifidobacteriaceae bacterium]
MAEQSISQKIEGDVLERLSHVIDPELGRSITDLKMVTGVDAALRTEDSGYSIPLQAAEGEPIYDVNVNLELTVAGCPLTEHILDSITAAVTTYPDAMLVPKVNVSSMSEEKLSGLVAELKAARRENPFSNPQSKTKIFAVVSGKGGVGKSSVSANLAATFAALGYDTAAIDADIYGFSLPNLFGVRSQPTNLDGMLMPVTQWGVKLMSIGMFAGTDKAILWRGPRLQRSLQQFLSDVWWGKPDVLVLDLAPGTGDMAISVAQMLPNAELIVVTTPQPSASEIAVRAGLISLQLPGHVRGVVENMSWYEHNGEKLHIFGEGGGERVATKLTASVGYPVPLLGRIPLETEIRTDAESGRPAVLDASGALVGNALSDQFVGIARQLMGKNDEDEA